MSFTGPIAASFPLLLGFFDFVPEVKQREERENKKGKEKKGKKRRKN